MHRGYRTPVRFIVRVGAPDEHINSRSGLAQESCFYSRRRFALLADGAATAWDEDGAAAFPLPCGRAADFPLP
jgi:hypothetical protein